jgi:hypothetical protein
MGSQRAGSLSRTRLRNLTQYRNMSDEEFDAMMDKMEMNVQESNAFNKRIQNKIDEIGKDYDLTDLKSNDMLTLRALCQSFITLEDFEQAMYKVRQQGMGLEDMIAIDKMNNIMSTVRKDISAMQNDLMITRKNRKGDSETSVTSEWDRLKLKAKELYERRMAYVMCPVCNNLLVTAWFHYPYEKGNKLSLTCNRIMDNGEVCGHKFTISSKELYERRGNNSDKLPETLK